MMNRNSFINNISEQSREREKIIKLQQRFSNGEITEEDLTEEEISQLHMLYDEQIEELKKKKEKCKRDIIKIRKRIKSNK